MGYEGTYNGSPGPKITKCHNCSLNVTGIELDKIEFTCPRCKARLFDTITKVRHINQPETGDNSPLVPGKPLRS